MRLTLQAGVAAIVCIVAASAWAEEPRTVTAPLPPKDTGWVEPQRAPEPANPPPSSPAAIQPEAPPAAAAATPPAPSGPEAAPPRQQRAARSTDQGRRRAASRRGRDTSANALNRRELRAIRHGARYGAPYWGYYNPRPLGPALNGYSGN